RIEPRVLRVDGDEHLDDVVFREPVEDDGGNRENLVAEPVHAGMQGEQPVLAVDGAEDTLALGYLERAQRPLLVDRFKTKRLVARDDHGPRNRGQVACRPTLLVVGDELVALPADDLWMVGLLARSDATLAQSTA